MADPLIDARSLYLQGNLQAAAEAYESALEAGCDVSACNLGLGLIAIDQGKSGEAVPLLKAAVAANPDNLTALTALGVAFSLSGLPAKAATVLLETLKRAPNALEPRLHLARAFSALQRFEDGMSVLREAEDRFQYDATYWHARGKLERQAGQLDQAYESFQHLCGLAPENAEAFNDLGVACRAIGNPQEAEQHYRRAITLDPNLSVAHANLGNVLELQDRLVEAETALRNAIALEPHNSDFSYNLATVLAKLERPDEATPLLETVTHLAPERWDAWTNLGVACLDCGNLVRAESALRQALKINPDNPEAHYNLAWLLILTDRHKEGWSELEWRWQMEDFSSRHRSFDCPLWTGAPLGTKTLLLHAEQGFGDTIQFCRFAADIPKQQGRIVLECQSALVSLLANLPGVDEVIAHGTALPIVDLHAPLLSLPNFTQYQGEKTEIADGYLRATPPRPTKLGVPERGKRRIGLVWAGSPENKIDRRRHVEIDLFQHLFDATDADFISLQIGNRAAEGAQLPSDKLTFSCEGVVKDFEDTAAVIEQLDLVIGVDTAVMHLAGALGKPAWILLPFMPDYRWGLGRSTTAWYDSLRLFRQPSRGDWESVFGDVCEALRSW